MTALTQRSSVNLTQSIILGWTRMKHETTKLEPFPIDFSISINWYQFISIQIDFLTSINSRILIINGNWSLFFDQKHPRLRTNGIHISYTPIGPTMSQVCVDSLLNHGFLKFFGSFSCVSFFRKGLLWTKKHDFKTIYIKTAATSMKPHCKSSAVSPRSWVCVTHVVCLRGFPSPVSLPITSRMGIQTSWINSSKWQWIDYSHPLFMGSHNPSTMDTYIAQLHQYAFGQGTEGT